MPGKLIILNLLLAIFAVAACVAGVFIPSVYAKETPSWAAQGMGQDIITLFIIIPAILVSFFAAKLGVLFYIMWLSEIVPSILSGQPPKTAIEINMPINPVHVIDISLILPAFMMK